MITSTYNISAGCLILFWGRLADIYGRRLVFMVGSTLFTIASLIIPFSPNEILFYVFRVVQGMSGAATIPSALGILSTTFPVGPARNKAFVTFAAAASLGSIIGNIAGGVVGGFLTWKWVFWIPTIISAIVTAAAFVLTRPVRNVSSIAEAVSTHTATVSEARVQSPARSYVDWIGGLMSSTALILLLIALSEANVVGWTRPWIPALIVISMLLLVVFVFWQRHLENNLRLQPLLRLSLFRDLRFSAAFLVIGSFYAAFNGFLIFTTFL